MRRVEQVKLARNADITLAYETFGPPGSPLLLISATDAQMLMYLEELCAALTDAGFQVARFDNRDAGLSTHLTGTPAVRSKPPYARRWRRTA